MAQSRMQRSRRPAAAVANRRLPLAAALALAGTLGFAAVARSREHRGAIDLAELPDTAVGAAIGASTAPVTVTVFADFECEACAIAVRRVEEPLRREAVASGVVKLRWIGTANTSHRFAIAAGVAATCAARQGRFAPMHDALYAHQSEWANPRTGSKRAFFVTYAAQAAVDTVRWGTCYDDPSARAEVDSQYAVARRVRIRGTPTYVVGKQVIEGVPAPGVLERAVAAARR